MTALTSKQQLLPVVVWVAVVILAALFASGEGPRHPRHGAPSASSVPVD